MTDPATATTETRRRRGTFSPARLTPIPGGPGPIGEKM